jgi:hypothetical protein
MSVTLSNEAYCTPLDEPLARLRVFATDSAIDRNTPVFTSALAQLDSAQGQFIEVASNLALLKIEHYLRTPDRHFTLRVGSIFIHDDIDDRDMLVRYEAPRFGRQPWIVAEFDVNVQDDRGYFNWAPTLLSALCDAVANCSASLTPALQEISEDMDEPLTEYEIKSLLKRVGAAK